jgi:succinoglycan biosynthesis protein ExoA
MVKALVVIPTLNEAATIEGLLTDLLADLSSDDEVTCVVADGGSADATRELVAKVRDRDPRVVLVDNPKRIQSAGVNLAVSLHGRDMDVLIRCDAHASYPRRLITKLITTLGATGADSVVVPMDSVGYDGVSSAIAWVSDTIVGSGGSRHRGGRRSGFVDHGHHAAFRMERFRALGGYDETFTHNEDAEYDCRLRKAGGTIYLDAALRVQYRPRQSLVQLARQYHRYGLGRSGTVLRHPESLRLRQLAVPTAMVSLAVCLIGAPLFPWLLIGPGAYGLVIVATSLLMAVRKRSAYGLMTGPAAAVMHASWAFGFIQGLLTRRAATAPVLAAFQP